ncbi:MAG: sugar ABC transporter permease [Candidatus Nanopelagicaceae bacterium]|nr:sugar ABC transporter permease [Candidatus Nanopelagicaceae bacterium]
MRTQVGVSDDRRALDSLKRTSKPSRREARTGLAFILPAFTMILLFVLLPSIGAIVLSTTEWYLVGKPSFVGIQNYNSIFMDPAFGQALLVTFQVALGVAIPGSLLALIFGLLLMRVGRGVSIYQTIFYLPLVIPSIVSSIIWGAMYVGNGVLNSILGVNIRWLANPVWALIAMLILMVWTNVGYYTILVYAGLQDLPHEVLEASSVDGANSWQRFRYVTLPLIRPILLFVTIVATTDALTLFVQPYLLTQGGPSGATQTLSLYIYKTAFAFADIGRASAMAVILLIIAISFAIVQFRVLRSSDD